MFDEYRKKRQLRLAELDFNIRQVQTLSGIVENAEATRFAREDPDINQWFFSGGLTQSGGKVIGQEMSGAETLGYDHYEMLAMAFKKFHTNLFCKAIVRNLCKFVLGKGPILKPKDDANKDELERMWKNFCKNNKWQLREKEIIRRVFRDGEVFLRRFVDEETGKTLIRFLRADNIRNPTSVNDFNSGEDVSLGIGTDPDDIENVKTYYYCSPGGELIDKIPSGDVLHIKIMVDSDMKRGLSFLLVTLPMIQKYMDWLDDRVVLNKVRSAIALIRNVEGTSGTVETIRDKYRAQTLSSDRNKQQGMSRGSVITASKGIKYEMLSPNIQAADVKDDGRAMLLAVAAGCGFPEMMLTADYSNANYSSSVTAQNPFVREIEDWQDFFASAFYGQVFSWCVEGYVKFGKAKLKGDPEDYMEFILEWPPLILADIEKNNKAREIQHRNKIISKTTWQLKEGLDPETEKKNQELESTEDVYKQPFNPTAAPVNQYGQFIDDDEFDEEKYEEVG